MSISATETVKVINHTVKSLISNVNYQIFAKQTLKKMPEHTFKALDRLKDNIIFVGNIPKPIYKREPLMQEDSMPYSPPKEGFLSSNVPLMKYSELQVQTPSTSNYDRRRNRSRYASTADRKQFSKQIHLDLSQVKQNKVIEIVNRSQQNTAKTFRSAIQLDSQIAEMRKTYIKNTKKQAELRLSQTKKDFGLKKKRLPKQFTFDFSGELLQKRNLTSKGIVFSPLKTKSVGIQKINKKVQESRNNSQVQSNNLQQILERAKTGSSQKKKREYNNLSRRQVSHIPFISLAQNIKLYQNDTKVEGEPKNIALDSTVYSSRKSNFMHYSQQNKERDDLNMSLSQATFPKNFKSISKEKVGEGKIIKNKALDKEIQDLNAFEDYIEDPVSQKIIFNKKL